MDERTDDWNDDRMVFRSIKYMVDGQTNKQARKTNKQQRNNKMKNSIRANEQKKMAEGQNIVHCAACSDEFRVKDVGLDRRRPSLPGQSLVVCFGLSFVANSVSARPRRMAPTEIYQLCYDAGVEECNSPWRRLVWPKN